MGMISGLLLAGATGWYWAKVRKTDKVRQAQEQVATHIEQAVDKVQAKLVAFELRGSDIKADLARSGEVVRQSAREFGEATTDTRITAAIKTKLLADRDLSAWSIAVNTTDGVVTLAGTVQTPEQIGRATLLALETAGVRKVKSTLQVK